MAAIQTLREEVPRAALLIGDTDTAQTRLIVVSAARAGWRTLVCRDLAQSIELTNSSPNLSVSVIIVDQEALEGADIAAAVTQLKRGFSGPPVLILSATGGSKELLDALRSGASDYLVKPIGSNRLLHALRSATAARWHSDGELEALANQVPAPVELSGLVGNDPRFRQAVATAARCSRGPGHILLEGESGSGKCTLAAAICSLSGNSNHTVKTINARSESEGSLESTLFGHEAGAFIGAFERRDGLLTLCEHGILIIQEINRLPLELQDRLANALAGKRLRPIGSQAEYQCNVRVIGLSNVSLHPLVESGRFSRSLHDVLGATRISLPPLRERSGDIEPIANYWLTRFAKDQGTEGMALSDGALARLTRFTWPGNIAQLQSVIARAVTTATSHILGAEHFTHLERSTPRVRGAAGETQLPPGGVRLFNDDGHIRELWEIEIDVIRLAVAHYRGRLAKVARHLGISRSTLYRKLDESGIEVTPKGLT